MALYWLLAMRCPSWNIIFGLLSRSLEMISLGHYWHRSVMQLDLVSISADAYNSYRTLDTPDAPPISFDDGLVHSGRPGRSLINIRPKNLSLLSAGPYHTSRNCWSPLSVQCRRFGDGWDFYSWTPSLHLTSSGGWQCFSCLCRWPIKRPFSNDRQWTGCGDASNNLRAFLHLVDGYLMVCPKTMYYTVRHIT